MQLVYSGTAWLGLGFSPRGQMIGSTVVIGLPEYDEVTGVYYLADKNVDSILPKEENEYEGDGLEINTTVSLSQAEETETPVPSTTPTSTPSISPVESPTAVPSSSSPTTPLASAQAEEATSGPSATPTSIPSISPVESPTMDPSSSPTATLATASPTRGPTDLPSPSPTKMPSIPPTKSPRSMPTWPPIPAPISPQRVVPAPTSSPTSWWDNWRRQLMDPSKDHRVLATGDHVLWQNDTHTILTFIVQGSETMVGSHHEGDVNQFDHLIYAVGSNNALGYHSKRGSIRRADICSTMRGDTSNDTMHMMVDDRTTSPTPLLDLQDGTNLVPTNAMTLSAANVKPDEMSPSSQSSSSRRLSFPFSVSCLFLSSIMLRLSL